VIARNVRILHDEIDLLVRFGSLLVAVEVKTRVGDDPAEELTTVKAARLRRAGARLTPRPRRYDLVTVCAAGEGVTVRWLVGAG